VVGTLWPETTIKQLISLIDYIIDFQGLIDYPFSDQATQR